MSHADFEEVRRVFLAARDLESQDRRELLDRECGTGALRDEVEALLAHHEAGDGNGGRPPLDERIDQVLRKTAERVVAAGTPERFGHYEILGVLGQGGMGTVFRARQRQPERVVALKVIRPGMATATLIRRFELEAELLGRLQHPGIAQVYEAGTEDTGAGVQPFFAMELVEGRPVTEHAQAEGLGTRERLALVARVCDAVHHAHQKGVIHRDLKPANILVDRAGQVKILDFGVARAIDSDIRSTTVQTNVGQLLGTVPYMSPEQVAGDPRALDLRSDVYALGVLTYELLSGRLPHDLAHKSVPEAARVIRDEPPTRLSSVRTVYRGDVETIVGKTLEKDPERRYQSASALADDLRRFLDHRPLVARPPSVSYQVRLFARRHRAVVVAGLVTAVALVVATAIGIGSAVRATRAAGAEARQRLTAERISAQMHRMLTSPTPHALGEDVTVLAMLDTMIARLDVEPEEPPEVEAAVRQSIAQAYRVLSRNEAALVQHERVAVLYRGLDPLSWETATGLYDLGHTQYQMGDHRSAEVNLREALRISEVRADERIHRGRIRSVLVEVLLGQSRAAEAEPIARELLEERRRLLVEDLDVVSTLRQLASIRHFRADHDEAEQLIREAIAMAAGCVRDEHPIHSALLDQLGLVLRVRGDREAATDVLAQAWARTQTHSPRGSIDWNHNCREYAFALIESGRRDDAETVVVSALGQLEETFGAEDDRTAAMRGFLGRLYRTWGQPEKAEALAPRPGPAPPQH